MTYTRLTKAFIGFMVLAAAGTIGDAILQGQGWHPLLAMTLLLAVWRATASAFSFRKFGLGRSFSFKSIVFWRQIARGSILIR